MEYTRIAFYRDRGYRDRSRDDGQQYSVITLDMSHASILPDIQPRAPEVAQVYIAPDEPLKLRVFVDKSVVEVFVNGRQCVAVRVYPGREDSVGVLLRSLGQASTLTSLDAWQMENIYLQMQAFMTSGRKHARCWLIQWIDGHNQSA